MNNNNLEEFENRLARKIAKENRKEIDDMFTWTKEDANWIGYKRAGWFGVALLIIVILLGIIGSQPGHCLFPLG